MANFRKRPHLVSLLHGSYNAMSEQLQSDKDGVVHYKHERVPLAELYPPEKDLPAENFSLEYQLKSGIPLKEVDSVILRDNAQARSFVETQLKDDESSTEDENV